jgi:hypothetical protein
MEINRTHRIDTMRTHLYQQIRLLIPVLILAVSLCGCGPSAIEQTAWQDAQAKGASQPGSYVDFHRKYPHSPYLTTVIADVECSQNLSISMGYGVSGTASLKSLTVVVNGHPDLSGEYSAEEAGAVSLCRRYMQLGGTIGELKGAKVLVANLKGKQRIVAVEMQ